MIRYPSPPGRVAIPTRAFGQWDRADVRPPVMPRLATGLRRSGHRFHAARFWRILEILQNPFLPIREPIQWRFSAAISLLYMLYTASGSHLTV